ncbi:MAG: WhiB family transcriptional regulator [Acidimicrobiia bacterium]|nr:WhiB family transcriptional regulator [Acidimicrobiia bacterium]
MTRLPAAVEQHAACRGTPIKWWYPTDARGYAVVDAVPTDAAARCSTCPAFSECHAHALRHEPFGVWAGTSEQTRQQLRHSAGIHLDTRDIDTIAHRIASGGGGDVHVIAGELDVSLRTVYRYLERAGQPVTSSDDWRRQPRSRHP